MMTTSSIKRLVVQDEAPGPGHDSFLARGLTQIPITRIEQISISTMNIIKSPADQSHGTLHFFSNALTSSKESHFRTEYCYLKLNHNQPRDSSTSSE
jgi:hypothetical protein